MEKEFDYEPLREYVMSRWKLGRTHGVSHWDRVRENGMKLLTEEVDPVVVQCFAYLHDSCREDDWEDLGHGERAARWIMTLRNTYLKDLTDKQFEQLQTAIFYHTTEHKMDEPTVDACFDADRLDLWRCGIKPDPAKMATTQGAKLAGEITPEKMIELMESIQRHYI